MQFSAPQASVVATPIPRLHKLAFLAIYVVANIYAAWVFIEAGATTNEFSGMSVTPTEVLIACAIAIAFLCGMMLIAQPGISRLVSHFVRPRPPLRNGAVGYVVSAILTSQLLFSVLTGTLVAGQLIYLDNAWAWFFLIVNGDYIFLAYYCFYRNSRWCYVNIALYFALGLVRGWGGMFLIVGFLEIGRQLRFKKYRNILAVLVAIALVAPVVYVLRDYVRGMGSNMQGREVFSLLDTGTFQSSSEFEGPIDAVTTMTNAILLRLQHLEVDLVVSSYRDSIIYNYENGFIRPFWAEGTAGKLALLLFDIPISLDLHQFLPGYFRGAHELLNIGYNVHTGLGSWMTVLGFSFPIVLLFSFFLLASAALLVRLNGETYEANDMLWLLALLFICSGWFSPYEAFLQALVVFFAIEAVCRRIFIWLNPTEPMAFSTRAAL